MFTGHTDNYKCNTWGLEEAAIPRRVKVQHIKGIANILADLVSRLKRGGIYHDIDSYDHQQEFSTPFEPLPPVEPLTHTPLEYMKLLLHLTLKYSCKFMTPYMTHLLYRLVILHDSPTAQTGDNIKLALENASPTDIPQLEESCQN